MKAGITLEFKEIVNRVSNHMIANMDKMRINRLKDGVAPGAGVKWTAARTLDWDLKLRLARIHVSIITSVSYRAFIIHI